MPVLIVQALPRKEDARLLTGGGRYSDDVDLPGQALTAERVWRAIREAKGNR